MAGNPNWLPGVSGNPSGRPRIKPLLEFARKWVDEKGENILKQIAENPKDKQRFEAVKLLFAYAIGRPIETSEVNATIEDGRTGDVNEVLSRAEGLRKTLSGTETGVSLNPGPDRVDH